MTELIHGSHAIFKALGGSKTILSEEKPTIDFAYACVVSVREINAGEKLSVDNNWVKRPGTGEIKAVHFESLLGKTAKHFIDKNKQLSWSDFE